MGFAANLKKWLQSSNDREEVARRWAREGAGRFGIGQCLGRSGSSFSATSGKGGRLDLGTCMVPVNGDGVFQGVNWEDRVEGTS